MQIHNYQARGVAQFIESVPSMGRIHSNNLCTHKVDKGGAEVRGHPWLHSKLEASLGHMRPFLKQNKNQC